MDFFAKKEQPVTEPTREKKAVITCDHVLQKTSTPNSLRMDAIIHHVTTIPAIKNLLCVSQHDYLPHVFEAVQVETDVYFKLTELKHKDGQLETIKFELFSYDHEVQFLQAFIDRCNTDFARKMANKLGTSLYYFDMITQNKSKKTMQNTLPNTHLLYTKHQFHTTRSFDNVFFEQRDKVRNHVQFFLTRKDWYEKKGIPYTLGFMFHGDPGCGKTSTIKAIANTAHRHILNIHLSEIKSKSQLRHLFFNDEIHVYNGTVTERFIIPVHERLYVIEDIDAMGDAVLKREWQKPVVPEKPKAKVGDPWLDNKENDDEIKDPIDLSFLLNLLDGTLEASGRILAISSNFPERIDRALIRPGRIDMIVHFKKCNRQILREMVSSFYDKEDNDWTNEELDYKWSPAEVNQILFRNFGDANEAINELKTLKSEDLYGFTSE
jgi:DNA polymerase III delta prime subunit